MTRSEAVLAINDLYGLESCYIELAVESLGLEALSDEALQWIAHQQATEERERTGQLHLLRPLQSSSRFLDCDS